MTHGVFLELFWCSTQQQFASGSPIITESCHLGSITQQIDIYGDEVYMGKNDKLSQGIRVSITCLDLVILPYTKRRFVLPHRTLLQTLFSTLILHALLTIFTCLSHMLISTLFDITCAHIAHTTTNAVLSKSESKSKLIRNSKTPPEVFRKNHSKPNPKYFENQTPSTVMPPIASFIIRKFPD